MDKQAKGLSGYMQFIGKWWSVIIPLVALVVLVLAWGQELPLWVALVLAAVLVGAILAAVHHAEVVAHRVGEPFGSIVLAVAVTIIEVSLILALMLGKSDGDHGNTDALARDTVFAAVMITCNLIVGTAILIGSLRHELPRFNSEGTGAALGVVGTLATLTLVLPTFTLSDPGPRFSPIQLAFVAVVSIVLYIAFLYTQAARHRGFFLPVDKRGQTIDTDDTHADPPSRRKMLISALMLIVSLIAVVGLAEVEAPGLEKMVASAGIPHSFVGVVIALVVLMPEGLAAAKAATRNRLQISLNLAYGSALASIGLTIPAIAVASIWLPGKLTLGLGGTQIVLLMITLIVSVLTVIPGRATRLQGVAHLVLGAAFVVTAIAP